MAQLVAIRALKLGLSIVLTPVVACSGDEPPTFAAFRTFCAETDAEPHAVEAALIAAGATKRREGTVHVEEFPQWVSTWTFGRISVMATRTRESGHGGEPDEIMTSCSVTGFEGSGAEIAAAKIWFDIPVRASISESTILYSYEQGDGRRIPFGTAGAVKQAKAAGSYRMLTINEFPTGTSMSLSRWQSVPSQ